MPAICLQIYIVYKRMDFADEDGNNAGKKVQILKSTKIGFQLCKMMRRIEGSVPSIGLATSFLTTMPREMRNYFVVFVVFSIKGACKYGYIVNISFVFFLILEKCSHG